ncbi:hypothetical protein [Aeoliella mucimassa]|uniref:Uncharacterized protein n=1 Tax=Aeoliella mucimassa TaxID=2527972 RepID=A0A518AWH9_9BACT|nr:hypothetical protein [Aeoliella mucimassa]QDU59073.1 hypothetical protein Pan181_53140 [Aeoliella mucimassa]
MSPENTNTDSQQSERAPLGVRLIAGALLLLGFIGMIDQVLDLATGRGLNLNLSFAAVLLGWGLLRRREWARFWVSGAFGLLFPLFAIGTVFTLFVPGDGIQLSPDPGLTGIWRRLYAVAFFGLMTAVAGAFWNHLLQQKTLDYFQNATNRPPFIVWPPNRWRIRLRSLLLVTLGVAICLVCAMYHPGIRRMKVARWAAAIDLNNPVYFPAGAAPLTLSNPYAPSEKTSTSGIECQLFYEMTEGDAFQVQPKLVFVLFNRWDSNRKTMHLERSWNSPLDESDRITFRSQQGDSLSFPGTCQIAEFYNGKLYTSDMHITLLEFWSFYQHPDSEWSIEGIERYVTDLRKRVAERDNR